MPKITLDIPIAAKMLDLKGRSTDEAIYQANLELQAEARKFPFAGQCTIGQEPSGRFYFEHLMFGRMVRVPDEKLEAAEKEIARRPLLLGVELKPPAGFDRLPQVHGLWLKAAVVDELVAAEGVHA